MCTVYCYVPVWKPIRFAYFEIHGVYRTKSAMIGHRVKFVQQRTNEIFCYIRVNFFLLCTPLEILYLIKTMSNRVLKCNVAR